MSRLSVMAAAYAARTRTRRSSLHTTRHRRRGSIVALALALGVVGATACSSSSKSSASDDVPSTTAAAAIPAPKGLPAFYAVPQPLPTKTGAFIKSEKVAAPELHGTVYRVMYV